MSSGRRWGVIVVAAIVVAATAGPAGAAVQQAPPPGLVELKGPTVVDTTNQAGWWGPIVEHGGATYYAYDSPGATAGTHTVRVVKRLASGQTQASCLSAGGTCIQ